MCREYPSTVIVSVIRLKNCDQLLSCLIKSKCWVTAIGMELNQTPLKGVCALCWVALRSSHTLSRGSVFV